MAADPDEYHRRIWFFEFFRGVCDPDVPSFEELISEQPPRTGDVRFDALLAASAEYVAEEHGVATPRWCLDESLRLGEPWNLAQWGHAKLLARRNSPTAFAKRNIYIESRDLINV
jgi:hypothetical protein